MDTLFLYNTKTLKEKFKTKVFAGDNLITKIAVQIPDNIGGYPKSECEYNLRAIIPEGNLSYTINPSQPYFYITNDITEKAQTVKLMMIITHEGNVIGRTNTVDLVVNEPAEAPDPPLTPREEFDEVIAEQRAEIAEQAETISEQATAIEAKDGQISELNGQVTELEAENAEQAQTITRQNTTIDELNRRVPPLQTLDPINPSQTQRTFNPESPNIGFPQVIVNPPTAEGLGFDYGNLKKDVEFLGGVGTYDPFPYNSVGGIYITEVDEDGYPVKFLIKDFEKTPATFPIFFNKSLNAVKSLKEIVFENCPSILYLGAEFATGLTYLSKFFFPENIKAINENCFKSCASIQTLLLPETITTIGRSAFRSMTNLREINLPASLTSFGGNDRTSVFYESNMLELVRLGHNFNCNGVVLSSSTRFTAETIVACLEALADRTGLTAYTITFGSTNLNKLTAEQRAIATNKNWNLA